jgi:hypothetical protein
MPTNVQAAGGATERKTLADVSTRAIKVEIRSSSPQVGATPLREVAAEAVRRASSQKAAAADIGISEARLSHKLKDGSLTLAQLEALGAKFGAELGAGCQQVYGSNDPKAVLRREIREARERMERAAELIEEIA